MKLPELPVTDVLSKLAASLAAHRRAILTAPPGSGKTTLVPLFLLPQIREGHRIIMLEPRRMAARAAAIRMAELLGESVGGTVGYQIRLERKASERTRILVVTEGVLTRMLISDPELERTSVLIFDEFHERSIHADTGLALALECQTALREDGDPLSILVMSATLETEPLRKMLSDAAPCPVIISEGTTYPIRTVHIPPSPGDDPYRPIPRVLAAIRKALAEEAGDILVFLPGGGEIRAVLERMDGTANSTVILPLYGDMPPDAQTTAILPDPKGRRKVVLATNIAESSLSIAGIRVVIDAGLEKRMSYDPATGMGRLVIGRISLSSADQRRGRASRFGCGVCYRLWNPHDEKGMQPHRRPEILDADLAGLRLELALWGVEDPSELKWLDTPPMETWTQSTRFLTDIGALATGANGRHHVTAHGKSLSSLPIHPRLAHMLLAAKRHHLTRVAAGIAAVMEERLPHPSPESHDLRLRLGHMPPSSREISRRLLSLVPPDPGEPPLDEQIDDAGIPLALAYPERVARLRNPSRPGEYLTVSGKGASIPPTDGLAKEPFIAIGGADIVGAVMRARYAAPISKNAVMAIFKDNYAMETVTDWDMHTDTLVTERRTLLGTIVIARQPDDHPDASTVGCAVVNGVRHLGLSALPWTKAINEWRARVLTMRCADATAWPDVRDVTLAETLETWLLPFLTGVTRKADLISVDLRGALASIPAPNGTHIMGRKLDEALPTHLTLPSGSVVQLSYDQSLITAETLPTLPAPPVLSVKLQELFGMTAHPTVLNGRLPVRIHLLSPAGRPLQVTQDIAGFWNGTYRTVRSEMRGRYPKHPWPENPLYAIPTKRTRNRM